MDALPPGARTPKKTPANLSSMTPVQFITRTIVELEPLPKFIDTSEGQWPKLFTKKIGHCEYIFDFSLPLLDIRNKELKTSALNEILLVVTEHSAGLGEQQYQEVIIMFAKNVFRAVPPPQNPVGEAFDPEDDEPVYDPSWPHMHLIYEVFIRLVESPSFNVNIARKFIDQLFVYRLLTLFDVEDPREREMVKTAVHRVYGKFLNLRAFIRKAMRHIFYEFIYEEERHNIAEMLEILGSVVNGFAVPLRDEHKIFLERTLVPLHKSRMLPSYYSQLSLCVIQFAEKDSSLVEKIVLGLLRFWPKTNTTKEIMFLNEIEEVLDVAPQECFESFLIPLANQLARSIASPHFQVAERALQYWNNEYVVSVVAEHIDAIMPIVLPPMLRYSRAHWNKNVQLQVFNGLRLFMDLHPRLYERISGSYDMPSGEERSNQWAQVRAMARRNSTTKSGERKNTDVATTQINTVQPSTRSSS
jgi:serine/threonine-protein phosphatase 2A regulatory subunit B'